MKLSKKKTVKKKKILKGGMKGISWVTPEKYTNLVCMTNMIPTQAN